MYGLSNNLYILRVTPSAEQSKRKQGKSGLRSTSFGPLQTCSCHRFLSFPCTGISVRTSTTENTLKFITWDLYNGRCGPLHDFVSLSAGLRKNSYQTCGPAETSPGWLVVSFYPMVTVSLSYGIFHFGLADRELRAKFVVYLHTNIYLWLNYTILLPVFLLCLYFLFYSIF